MILLMRVLLSLRPAIAGLVLRLVFTDFLFQELSKFLGIHPVELLCNPTEKGMKPVSLLAIQGEVVSEPMGIAENLLHVTAAFHSPWEFLQELFDRGEAVARTLSIKLSHLRLIKALVIIRPVPLFFLFSDLVRAICGTDKIRGLSIWPFVSLLVITCSHRVLRPGNKIHQHREIFACPSNRLYQTTPIFSSWHKKLTSNKVGRLSCPFR